jgi:hypothetical protein
MSDDPCPGVEIIDDYYYKSMTAKRVQLVESRKVDPWEDPVFADFVIIRDYLEELDIKTKFRLVYPTPQNLDTFLPCFDRLCYQDLVFNSWIVMSQERKLAVLKKHFDRYQKKMGDVMKELFHVEEKK